MATGSIRKPRFVHSYVDWTYGTIAAGSAVHTSLKNLIDADMPSSGATFFALNGYNTGNTSVIVAQLRYATSDWGITVKNIASSAVTTGFIRVYYIYYI